LTKVQKITPNKHGSPVPRFISQAYRFQLNLTSKAFRTTFAGKL
jgi:hypothetical protein